jgi:hypothetical protein
MAFHAFGHVHLLFLAGFPGIPLAVIAGSRSRRPVAWSAFAFALCWLQLISGVYVTCLFALWCAFMLPAAILVARHSGGSVRRMFVVLAGFALGGIAAAFVLLPMLAHYRAFGAAMPENPLEYTVQHSATLLGYLLPPDLLSTVRSLPSELPGVLGLPGGRDENSNFVGLLGLVAAVAGAAIAIRGLSGAQATSGVGRWTLPLVVACAATAFVLSLGPYLKPEISGARLPFAYLYAGLPEMRFFRAPARFGIIVHLAMAVLGGVGLDALCRRLANAGRQTLVLIVVAVAVAITAVEFYPVGGLLKIDTIDAPLTAWFRSSPAKSPFVEVPGNPFGVLSQLPRHSTPTVNGYSGYPIHNRDQELAFFTREFPSDESLLLLERWGVDRVVLRDSASAPQRSAAAASTHLFVVHSEPGATLYGLRQRPMTFGDFLTRTGTRTTESLCLVDNGRPRDDGWEMTPWNLDPPRGAEAGSLRQLTSVAPSAQLVFTSKAGGTDLTSFTQLRIVLSVKNWYPLREPAALYWSTADAPDYDEVRTCKFVLPADGDVHELVVPVGENLSWLTAKPVLKLRMDLTARLRDTLTVESIAFERAPVQWALRDQQHGE